MLIDGELDAVLGEKSEHPDLRPLFPDAAVAERSWFARHKVLPINHMVVVSRALSDQRPDVVREVHRLLAQAAESSPAAPRFSRDEMRRSLELIVLYTAQQKLIPRAYAVDELFDDAARPLIQEMT
jgi:4,5-dihydroxyphthalate decarboxylase